MANEYLKRTPTSTGNRKVFTWSGWVKKTENSDGFGRFFESGTIGNRTYFTYTDVDEPRFTEQASNSNRDSLVSNYKLRDSSSICNVMIAVNSTLSNEDDRVKMYINGSLINNHGFSTDDPPALNALFQHNESGEMQYIGNSANQAADFQGYMSDVFHVDGQALTPDVFGFYKDGDGYMSSGSTQATDFRPGQWMPHSPTKIKKDVNRRGGFGVNGYYLPMNDPSNPGADFHCDPNSIIKLKGEDLPQPQNGAPTTSDAYVSQLRTHTGGLFNDGVVNFNGSGDRNALQDSGNAVNLGTGAFTVEAFVYHSDLPQNALQYIFMNTSQSNINTFAFAVENDRIVAGKWSGSFANSTKVEATFPVGSLKTGRWYHYAACRSGNTLRLFIDGKMVVQDTSHTENYNNTSQYGCRVGCESGAGATVAGYKPIRGFISNVRVVNGTALYTSDFTPPTEPLTNVTNTVLLCCQSPTSATAAAVSPGTLSLLTETGDRAAVAARNELDASIVLAVPGISTATGVNQIVNGTFDSGTTSWTAAANATLTNPGGVMRITVSATAGASQVVSGLTIGERYTLSFRVRTDGTNFANISLNQNGTFTYVGNKTSTDFEQVNYSFAATHGTVTVTPYKATSGWAEFDDFVLREEDAPRDYSADIKGSGTNKTLTANGSAGVGYEVGNYYGSALSFDGNASTNFSLGNNNDFDFGSDDFTIEFWRKRNIISSSEAYFTKYDNGETQSFWFGSTSNGRDGFWWYDATNGTSSIITANNTAVVDQFDHLCAERYGGTVSLYINGVVAAVDYHDIIVNNVVPLNVTTHNVKIGANDDTDGTTYYPFDGEIQDLRVYRGLAKYKGGFDVPKPYTPVGIEAFRTNADTCKNNFATLNAIDNDGGVLTNGNLTQNDNGSDGWNNSRATIGALNGKWYWEMRVDAINQVICASVAGPSGNDSTNGARLGQLPGQNDDAGVTYYNNGRLYHADSQTGGQVAWGAAYSATDVIGIALDMDDSGGKVWFSKNGSWQASGNPSTGANPARSNLKTYADTYFPISGTYFANTTQTFNFGQNPSFSGTVTAGTNADDSGKGLFKYAPPSGFLALCEDNLPTPAIADPGKHFKAMLYEGDNTPTKEVKGVGFQPDLIFFKNRDDTVGWNIFDSVRGPSKQLRSESFGADVTRSGGGCFFNEDGFTVSNRANNNNPNSYVAYCWKAGGAVVPNTDGSITSQVSANQDAGFSIVSYTGNGTNLATVGHGLNKEVKFMITKSRTTTDNWVVHTDATGTQTYSFLNTTATLSSDSVTAPSSSVFYRGTSDTINGNTKRYISYCFAEIEGYSKIGTYVGNNSADGPFVYCGFKPAWVMVKSTSTTSNWLIMDNARNSTNPVDLDFYANLNNAESQYARFDYVSNGFKVRNTSSEMNTNNATYVFMAFAESPFQTANAK